ncbi:MAG: aminomethyltransferase family protein [Nocardioidaceae bacterium]
MYKTTPFYERLRDLNETGLWGHWSNYLSALRYDMSAKHEYFAVRNSAGFFDTSPLYKYWIRGKDAERFLAGVLTRDIRICKAGHAQYTVWCDDNGYVLEDGVVFRHSDNEFFMTAARPNLAYFEDLVGRLDVTIEDVSEHFGMLAVQGPRSREILGQLTSDVNDLKYFDHTPSKIGKASVTISRTGYTGDLGFEVLVGAEDALDVLDQVIDAGSGRGFRPFGEDALLMARIEAGLILIDVEFSSSRLAYNDDERVTPRELGFGWMLRKVDTDDRPFIGRKALIREARDKTSRWSTVGLVVDWKHYDDLYNAAGLIPPKDETPLAWESMLYEGDGQRIGYATSLMYSPALQRHIAMARVHPYQAAPGNTVHLELTINHEYQTVRADVARMPLFNPSRKTA